MICAPYSRIGDPTTAAVLSHTQLPSYPCDTYAVRRPYHHNRMHTPIAADVATKPTGRSPIDAAPQRQWNSLEALHRSFLQKFPFKLVVQPPGEIMNLKRKTRYSLNWIVCKEADQRRWNWVLKSVQRHYQYDGKLRRQKWPCFWEAKYWILKNETCENRAYT